MGTEAEFRRKVHHVMSEFKRGTLRSGGPRGPKVKSREQAIAIALNSARRETGLHDAGRA